MMAASTAIAIHVVVATLFMGASRSNYQAAASLNGCASQRVARGAAGAGAFAAGNVPVSGTPIGPTGM
jgi:hypothetical protein